MNKTVKVLIGLVSVLVLVNVVLIVQLMKSSALLNPEIVGMIRELPPELQEDLLTRVRRYQLHHQQVGHLRKRMQLFREWHRNLMESQQREIQDLKKLEREVYKELLTEKPDTIHLFQKLDSIHVLRGILKKKAIEFYLSHRDSLPPEEREFIVRNMFREPNPHKHKKWRIEK
jgi:hypothetical protein